MLEKMQSENRMLETPPAVAPHPWKMGALVPPLEVRGRHHFHHPWILEVVQCSHPWRLGVIMMMLILVTSLSFKGLLVTISVRNGGDGGCGAGVLQ